MDRLMDLYGIVENVVVALAMTYFFVLVSNLLYAVGQSLGVRYFGATPVIQIVCDRMVPSFDVFSKEDLEFTDGAKFDLTYIAGNVMSAICSFVFAWLTTVAAGNGDVAYTIAFCLATLYNFRNAFSNFDDITDAVAEKWEERRSSN